MQGKCLVLGLLCGQHWDLPPQLSSSQIFRTAAGQGLPLQPSPLLLQSKREYLFQRGSEDLSELHEGGAGSGKGAGGRGG